MFSDKTSPNELQFWKNRLLDRTILYALDVYPDEAKRIFGSVPVMRKQIFQLGMILAAREVLADPSGASSWDLETILRELKLEHLLAKWGLQHRPEMACWFSQEMREKKAIEWAESVIKEATGIKPSAGGDG